MRRKRFPFYCQNDAVDCGPTCLRMISKYYGREYSSQYICGKINVGREGVSLLGLDKAARALGMHALGVRITFKKLERDVHLPCIAHWEQNHYIVIYRIQENRVFVANPRYGLLIYSKEEFIRGWISADKTRGVVLIIKPTSEFFIKHKEKNEKDIYHPPKKILRVC